ncbi:MAG: YbaK/EbsC family protein [Myxococcota bacterium]
MTVVERVSALLEGVEHTRLEHAPAFTADEAAAARGTPLSIGGKSLVLKIGPGEQGRFAVFVVSGARRTSNKAIRNALGIQRLRFATREELLALTGLEPGCVPPFGRPVFDLPLYVDTLTLEQPQIAFSLGSHALSAVLRTEDYARIAHPDRVFRFSRD